MYTFLLSCLISCVSDSPIVVESPSFWTAIANNPNTETNIRRKCVRELIKRHAVVGMSLTDFTRLLDKPIWLKHSDYTNWNNVPLGGYIPVHVDFDKKNTVFCFRVFPELPGDVEAVYFRVSGNLDVEDVEQLMQGTNLPRLKGARILEIAVSFFSQSSQ